MIKVFISQRTGNKKFNEVMKDRQEIVDGMSKDELFWKYIAEIEIINSLLGEYIPQKSNPILFLGYSISKMSDADLVLIPIDYMASHGCKIEYFVAKEYGIPIYTYFKSVDGKYNFLRVVEV